MCPQSPGNTQCVGTKGSGEGGKEGGKQRSVAYCALVRDGGRREGQLHRAGTGGWRASQLGAGSCMCGIRAQARLGDKLCVNKY